ncbi:hypothetical protein Enr13x_44260 [Stieleria neptunia]|uniref:Planctomycete cytochrome C n=1 Tax=Stieleria neptunia TaxID=2527979 RepID=A0A518HUP4_9BACT|nr:DUF1592 domain-containing protein [Stieleria neptunia]QDV44560.1 hypothetical protein Enr13x_44260 [Stieleria neptunia]
MKWTLSLFFASVMLLQSNGRADTLDPAVKSLVESSCIHCHDAATDTGLNFESLGTDLSDDAVARRWEQVFDRARTGDMPPEDEERPDPEVLAAATEALHQAMTRASLAKQSSGRVPARRLTKLELRYTMQDLLGIEADVTSGVPDEVESGSFDTVGANQRISAVHMESYLAAAGEALTHAIRLGDNPFRKIADHAATNFAHLEPWHNKPLNLGGSITRKLKFSPGVVMFRDVDYLTQFTYQIPVAGIYRLRAGLAAYQSEKPVTVKIIVKNQSGSAKLAASRDLLPGEPFELVLETYLRPGDAPYLTFDDSVQTGVNIFSAGGAANYRGPGMAITEQSIEGPIHESWPPASTTNLLGDLVSKSGDAEIADVRASMEDIAPRLFRRPVIESEIDDFMRLAQPAMRDGRGAIEALKVSLRSMLSSPQFLLFGGQPGELDDHALASRLSYFLWRSLPDEKLFDAAKEGTLSDPKTLADQVDRMLADAKAERFVKDFVGQWLWLHRINATAPDDGLYPEFDELLGTALPTETELFFAHLIENNRPARDLIDSDDTFLNRRLAQHYGIDGVEGQHFRRVTIPDNRPRGGVLTQAAVLKVTANGTSTSPVTRGNFVLTNFLGTPPAPPPPSVGSIEPDTRGKTTIREILAAHRDMETCNQCHKHIDPPGFALESFDPIGGYRTRYRASGGEREFGGFVAKLPPREGPPVDSSGKTAEGEAFDGIEQYKQHLLDKEELIVRHFISQLIVFGTGSEIGFADREAIDQIMNETRDDDFRVKNILHAIFQSRLFREK